MTLNGLGRRRPRCCARYAIDGRHTAWHVQHGSQHTHLIDFPQLRVIPGVLTCLPNNETKCLLLNTVEVERLVRTGHQHPETHNAMHIHPPLAQFHWFGIIGMSAQPYELLLLENGAVHKYPVVVGVVANRSM